MVQYRKYCIFLFLSDSETETGGILDLSGSEEVREC